MPDRVAQQHASTTSGRLATWSWYLAVLLAVWWLSFNRMRGSDFWWHLASGRWIVEHQAMARLDPYSFSAHGQPWLNNEWLGDVVFFFWTSAAGLESLVYWFWGMLLATYGLLFQLCRKLGGSPLASFIGVAMAVAASVPFFEFRPNLYSLLLFVVLLWLLLPRRPLWPGLPLLFVAWVNLHPGFIFGLAAAAAVVAIDVAVDASRARRSGGGAAGALAGHRRDILVLAGCALAGLLNPFGVQSYVHPLVWALDSGSPYRKIKEWLPPFAQDGVSPPVFPYLMALFLAACLVLLRQPSRGLPLDEAPKVRGRFPPKPSSKGRPGEGCRSSTKPGERWAILALGGVTLCMALASARFIPLFSICACLAISLLPAASRARRSVLARWQPRPVLRTALPLVLAVACAAMLARFPLDRRAFRHLISLESFPVNTLDFVEASRLSGRLFAYYGWGGYVEYRTRGRLQIYIDGRAATVYSPALFNAYRRVQYLLPGWQEVVESSGADYLLWPNLETPQVRQIEQPQQLLASGRWRKVYEDFVSVLLVRATVPPAPAPAPAPAPRGPSPYGELALGGLAMRGGDKQGAETHLRAALRLDSDMLAACRNLALVLAWQDRVSEAWAQHARCERIFPEPESAEDLRAFEERRRRRAQVLPGGPEALAGRGQRYAAAWMR